MFQDYYLNIHVEFLRKIVSEYLWIESLLKEEKIEENRRIKDEILFQSRLPLRGKPVQKSMPSCCLNCTVHQKQVFHATHNPCRLTLHISCSFQFHENPEQRTHDQHSDFFPLASYSRFDAQKQDCLECCSQLSSSEIQAELAIQANFPNLPNLPNTVKIKNLFNISKFKIILFISFQNTLNLCSEHFELSLKYFM